VDGHRLRQLRRQRGLSQEKLADKAGISPATVARLERQARACCRCRTLARLAAVLGEQPATFAAANHPDGRTRELLNAREDLAPPPGRSTYRVRDAAR